MLVLQAHVPWVVSTVFPRFKYHEGAWKCVSFKIMASGPITSWKIDGETVETVADFIFLGSKITAGGNCSHEIKKKKTC